MESQPVATYSEKRFSGKRNYTLYPGKVRVEGKVGLGNYFDAVVDVKNMRSDYDRIRIREKGFFAGIWLIVASFLAIAALASVFNVSFDHVFMVMMACCGMAGLVLCASTFRKVEIYTFKNSSGVPVLSIARNRKDSRQFDLFIEQLIKYIDAE
ncbi:MAG: hypothetical protein ACYS8Z_08280 [Planctomycetota bacterium]|jgi:hypothetical protein